MHVVYGAKRLRAGNICMRLHMRVDLSPRLGGDTVANQPPHYCHPLIHLHSPPPAAGTV